MNVIDVAFDATLRRFRYHDPVIGRFTSFDSFEGPVSDPASLHKYNYASSDPVNRTDPTGMFSVIEGAKVGGIIGFALGFSFGAFRGYQHTGELFSLETLQYAALYGLAGFAAGALIGAASAYLVSGLSASSYMGANGIGPLGTYTRVTTKIVDHVVKNVILGRPNSAALGGLGYTTGAFLGGVIAGASVYVLTDVQQSESFDEYVIGGLATTTLTVPFWRFVTALGSHGRVAAGPIVLATAFVAGFNAGYFGAKSLDAAGESLNVW